MTKVYLGLGSNLGDRRNNLEQALAMVSDLPWTTLERVSSFMESRPQGVWDAASGCAGAVDMESQVDGVCDGDGSYGAEAFGKGDFLNCCCRIETGLEPLELLAALKDIERKLGRTNEGIRMNDDGIRVYSDRTLDIDILLYGDLTVDLPELKIPHPRMQERDFVMIPLREI